MTKKQAPKVGVGLRRAHFADVIAQRRAPDFFQIIPEAFLEIGGSASLALAAAAEMAPLVAHGVSMNLGSPDPLRVSDIDKLAGFLDLHHIDSFSEHVCASAIDGVESFDLLPVPYSPIWAEYMAKRVQRVQQALRRAVSLENISAYTVAPGGVLSEGRFLALLLEQANAGLLLDVANIVVNARNRGLDAKQLLLAMPLDRVTEIHLAGHRFDERLGLTIDDHASAISNDTLELLRFALPRIPASVPVLVEWDQSLPSYERLLEEAERVRAVMLEVRVTNEVAGVV